VITQPGFIHERGDQYLRDVAAVEHDTLYRCHSLLAHGIPVAGSTDAPYGNPDPWRAMRASVSRRSRGGRVLAEHERLSPEQALALFTSAADDPGGGSRRIAVGEVADLCLLNCDWQAARLHLCSANVRATLRGGTVIYQQEQQVFRRRHDAAVVA